MSSKKFRLLIVYAVILVIPHFFRVFDNYFWGDEAYTINLARMSVSDFVRETASDVHPPLYYLIVKIFGTVFGSHGWTYHLASFCGYLAVVVITLTYLYRRLGPIFCAVFLTCISLLPNTFTYNVEVRNYSYGALFVLLTFLALERVLKENRLKDYALFAVFGLCAAYTHYYCLISVAFLYVVMLLYSFAKGKDRTGKALGASGLTVICYLPWLFVLIDTMKRSTGGFWMLWIPTLEDCIYYIFYGKGSRILFGLLMVMSLVYLLSNLKARRAGMQPERWAEAPVKESFGPDLIWMLSAAFSLFGTIFVGILVSKLIRPLFITRYLYPVTILAWFALAYTISKAKIKGRTLIMALTMGIIVLFSFSEDLQIVQEEYRADKGLQVTLSNMDVQGSDRILTDLQAIDWTVSECYFPGVDHALISEEDQPELNRNDRYWFILNAGAGDLYGPEVLSQDYDFECVVQNGSMGTFDVDVYLATPRGHIISE